MFRRFLERFRSWRARSAPVSVDLSSTDHDAVFRRGAELIEPYLILGGRRESTSSRKGPEVRAGIACLDRALELRPENWVALFFRGKAYQTLGEHEQAADSFREAHRRQPAHPDVSRELAVSLIELRRFGEAVEIAAAISAAQPEDAGLKANLALALLLDRRLDDARRTIDAAFQMDPSDPVTATLRRRIEEISDGRRPQPATMDELKR